jgi:hypothetical protein
MVLIVARHSFGNLFRGELAVIFGVQNVCQRTRIRKHIEAPLFLMYMLFGASPR